MLTLFIGPEHSMNSSLHHHKNIAKKSSTRKENATLAQRIQILDWHHVNGKNQQKTADHFNVMYPNLQLKQPRISDWCKNESRWQAEYEQSSIMGHSTK